LASLCPTWPAPQRTYAALNGLTDAGVLEVLSQNKRNRIWAATDVLAELDALSAAIGRRSTHPQA